MDKVLFNKAIVRVVIASVLNLMAAGYVFFAFPPVRFRGYLVGALLAVVLSALWLRQVRNGVSANFIRLLRFTLGGLVLRLGILLLLVAAMSLLVIFDRMFFAMAFLAGTAMSVYIEVWFYQALLTLERSAAKDAE